MLSSMYFRRACGESPRVEASARREPTVVVFVLPSHAETLRRGHGRATTMGHYQSEDLGAGRRAEISVELIGVVAPGLHK